MQKCKTKLGGGYMSTCFVIMFYRLHLYCVFYFECIEYLIKKNKSKCFIKKGESRKEGEVTAKKDIISPRTYSSAGDRGESFRHLEYYMLSAVIGELVSNSRQFWHLISNLRVPKKFPGGSDI